MKDFLVRDRFLNVDDQSLERNMVANIPLKYGKKFFVKEKKENIICKFAFNFDCIDSSQENSSTFEEVKQTNYSFAFKKKYETPIKPIISTPPKKKHNLYVNHKETQKMKAHCISNIVINEKNEELNPLKLSFREKVFVTFRGSKIVNLSIEGQLLLSGNLPIQEIFIKMNDFWQNTQNLKTRITPNNGVNINRIKEDTYK